MLRQIQTFSSHWLVHWAVIQQSWTILAMIENRDSKQSLLLLRLLLIFLFLFLILSHWLKHWGGPVRGGRFPAFHGNILIFPAFRSFFLIFRFSATFKKSFPISAAFQKSFPVSTVILKFSGFPWFENGFFRLPSDLPFPVFRRLFWPFPPFRHISYTPSLSSNRTDLDIVIAMTENLSSKHDKSVFIPAIFLWKYPHRLSFGSTKSFMLSIGQIWPHTTIPCSHVICNSWWRCWHNLYRACFSWIT